MKRYDFVRKNGSLGKMEPREDGEFIRVDDVDTIMIALERIAFEVDSKGFSKLDDLNKAVLLYKNKNISKVLEK